MADHPCRPSRAVALGEEGWGLTAVGRGKMVTWPLGKAMEVVREGPTLNML